MAIGPMGPGGERQGQAGPRGEAPGSAGSGSGPTGPRGEKVGQAGPNGETPGSGGTKSSDSSTNSRGDSTSDSAELKEAKKQLKSDTEAGNVQAIKDDQEKIRELQQRYAGFAA